jgi:membrane protease YdiL (CAAX protease family)
MAAEPASRERSGPGARPAPRVFAPWLTAVSGAVFLVLAVAAVWPGGGLETLEWPEESLERVVAREMDFRAAARTAPAWERALYALVFSSDAAARADAIAWYDELVAQDASPTAELERVVLLAEDGRDAGVAAALAAWEPGDDEATRLLAWAEVAYGAGPADPEASRAALTAVRAELPAGWFTDRLVARLAERAGEPGLAAGARAATLRRGTALAWRHRVFLGLELLLLALGVAALLGAGRRPGVVVPRLAAAPVPPPWSGLDGLGMVARGGAGLVGISALGSFLPEAAWSTALVSVASAAPLLLCVLAYCRARGIRAAPLFGLAVGRARALALGGTAVALVGLSTLADLAVEVAGTQLDLAPHWTDGFQERLVWGTRGDVLADLLDSVVVAPIVEELLFRGLLYATLRIRLGPAPAALGSAAAFALAHGYGAVGFGAVLASGVLWALAYERTRSLLPGILAHGAGNLVTTAIVLATLRW